MYCGLEDSLDNFSLKTRQLMNSLTLNGEHYRNVIIHYFVTHFIDIAVEDVLFQSDGATCLFLVKH